MSTITTRVPEPTAVGAVSPESIMRVAAGFMAAKHLFAASELGLFEALADAPATLESLAARTGLTTRAARISADAMVALGLLHRDGDHYSNSPAARRFLAGASPADLRPLLRFWDKVSYPAWEALASCLSSGPSTEVFDLDDATQQIVSAGIEAALAGPAHALGHAVDFSGSTRLLDIAGGTGSWSIAVARQHPHLEATILELAVPAEIARDRVTQAGVGDRVTVIVGDAMTGDLPPGHDVFLVANLVHYWSPSDNADLLRRIRAAAGSGARLLLADFWTDSTHTEPLHAALMAGEFAVHLRDGDVYSVEEVQDWLDVTGWRFVEVVPLAGPQRVIVAVAA